MVNVQRLADLLRDQLNVNPTNRGLPCSVEQIVCSVSEILAGGQFFRVNSYAGGVCKSMAWKNLYRWLLTIQRCFFVSLYLK